MALTLAAGATSPGQPRQPVLPNLSLFPLRTVWTLALSDELDGTPGFHGTRGYLPLTNDRLRAYDLTTGSPLWTVDAPSTKVPVGGDSLVFLVDPTALTARRERDGALAWRTPLSAPLAVPPVWDNGWLIAATTAGSVLAYRAADGQLIWRREIGATASARPALAADRVYVPTSDKRMVALQVQSGEPVWEQTAGGPPGDVLALDDRVYFGSTDNRFYCLLASSGQVDWRWSTGGDVVGLPAADDERVYFVALDNVLRALDRRTGNQKWRRALPLRPAGGPLVAAGTVIVRGLGAAARAYAPATGAPIGELPGGELAGQPHLAAQVPLPLMVVLSRDFQKGTTLSAVTRSVEPALAPVAPLPNPIVLPTEK